MTSALWFYAGLLVGQVSIVLVFALFRDESEHESDAVDARQA